MSLSLILTLPSPCTLLLLNTNSAKHTRVNIIHIDLWCLVNNSVWRILEYFLSLYILRTFPYNFFALHSGFTSKIIWELNWILSIFKIWASLMVWNECKVVIWFLNCVKLADIRRLNYILSLHEKLFRCIIERVLCTWSRISALSFSIFVRDLLSCEVFKWALRVRGLNILLIPWLSSSWSFNQCNVLFFIVRLDLNSLCIGKKFLCSDPVLWSGSVLWALPGPPATLRPIELMWHLDSLQLKYLEL